MNGSMHFYDEVSIKGHNRSCKQFLVVIVNFSQYDKKIAEYDKFSLLMDSR